MQRAGHAQQNGQEESRTHSSSQITKSGPALLPGGVFHKGGHSHHRGDEGGRGSSYPCAHFIVLQSSDDLFQYLLICYLPTLNANFRRGTLCFAHSCTQRPRGPRTVPGKWQAFSKPLWNEGIREGGFSGIFKETLDSEAAKCLGRGCFHPVATRTWLWSHC